MRARQRRDPRPAPPENSAAGIVAPAAASVVAAAAAIAPAAAVAPAAVAAAAVAAIVAAIVAAAVPVAAAPAPAVAAAAAAQQKNQIEKLRGLNQTVQVIYSKEEVDRFMSEFGGGI